MDWKQYEQEIADYFRAEYPKAKITHDAKVIGRFSKVERQLDILIEEDVCDSHVRMIVDGKFHHTKIDVKEVEAFIGLLRDVDAHKGIMISAEGYTPAAFNRACYDTLDLDLDVLNFKDLDQFHSPGAILYSGENGVCLSAPFGWVIDGTRREGAVATLYQRGRTLGSAGKALEWMYVNFWAKDDAANDIDSLLKLQEVGRKKDCPSAEIVYKDGPSRPDAKTKLRIYRNPSYPTPEYAGFVEFKDFIFFCVMFSPPELENNNLRKLRYVIRKVLPLKVQHKSLGKVE